MTRKRFVKLMMAYGLDRNTANDLSKIFRRINIGYFDLYRPILTLNKTKDKQADLLTGQSVSHCAEI